MAGKHLANDFGKFSGLPFFVIFIRKISQKKNLYYLFFYHVSHCIFISHILLSAISYNSNINCLTLVGFEPVKLPAMTLPLAAAEHFFWTMVTCKI